MGVLTNGLDPPWTQLSEPARAPKPPAI